MQHLKMLILTLLSMVFLPFASGWGIMFYSGENCNEDANFDSSSYWGDSTDASWCLQAGEPGQNCKWHTNEGANEYECSVPTNPFPGSYRYSEGSYCCIEIENNTECKYKSCDVPGPEHCYATKWIPYELHVQNYLTFTCSDVVGDRKWAVTLNATYSGAFPHA